MEKVYTSSGRYIRGVNCSGRCGRAGGRLVPGGTVRNSRADCEGWQSGACHGIVSSHTVTSTPPCQQLTVTPRTVCLTKQPTQLSKCLQIDREPFSRKGSDLLRHVRDTSIWRHLAQITCYLMAAPDVGSGKKKTQILTFSKCQLNVAQFYLKVFNVESLIW